MANAVKKITDKHGQIDVLINNAGVNNPTDFDDITDDEWDDILTINLRGPFICAQETFKTMKISGGSVVNIGSVSGQYGGPRTAHYAASKAGLISLSQVMARYGASCGIRSNTVSAGLISSEMAISALDDPTVNAAKERILMRRVGRPEEVADVVGFLSSERSSYVTAQTFNVNGGLYF